MIFVVAFVAGWLALAVIPARIAESKGRSYAGFYIAALFCFFPALIVAMAVSKPNIREGDIVRVSRRVELDHGGTIPDGHAAKVLEVDVIDGEPVVLIKGPTGASHWIAMKAVGGGPGGARRANGGDGVDVWTVALVAAVVLPLLLEGLIGRFQSIPWMLIVIGLSVVSVLILRDVADGRTPNSNLRIAVVVGLVLYSPLLILALPYVTIVTFTLGVLPMVLGVTAFLRSRPGHALLPQARTDVMGPTVRHDQLRSLPREYAAGEISQAAFDDTRQSYLGYRVPPTAPPPPPPPALTAAPAAQIAWLAEADEGDPFRIPREPRVRFELTRVDPRSPERRATCPSLGVAYDLASWFPVASGAEAATAAFVVSVVLLDGSDRPSGFAVRGKSTLLLTTQRLLGVCPQGESSTGSFRAEDGNVAVWTMALDDMDRITLATSASKEHAVVRDRQTRKPWLLLAHPRQVVNGSLQPVGLRDVVGRMNEAVLGRGH